MRGKTMSPKVREIMAPIEEPEILGGMARFYGLTAESGEELLRLLPELSDDTQNWSPTAREFIDLAKRIPGTLLDGYRIIPTRSDERYSIEACRIPREECTVDLVLELYEMGPDEMGWDGDYLRLWWD